MVRARMAPSPTGKLHIGTAHTTLFNWLFTRHNKGVFILRIDDSDKERSKPEFEKDIVDGIKWLGLNWDEGSYRQSDNANIYEKYVKQLLMSDNAYYCFCSREELEKERAEQVKNKLVPHYSGKCRNLNEEERKEKEKRGIKPIIRFKVPNKIVAFNDMVRGHIEVNMGQFGDFVIMRSDGSALLNFAVVIDDIEMKITHIIRGEDFLNATPFQILIYEALGVNPPKIANLSFIYAPDHSKLSKRHGATGVSEYKDMGYLPEAMVNFLALISWNPGGDSEIFSLDELIEKFDISKVQKSAPTFNIEKLNWFNAYYIRSKSDDELADLLLPFALQNATKEKMLEIIPLIKERIKTLSEIQDYAGFFFEEPAIDRSLFGGNSKQHLAAVLEVFENLNNWNLETLNEKLMEKVQENSFKTGDFFMDLRLAITGKKFTPPINDSIIILGKDKTIERIRKVLSN